MEAVERTKAPLDADGENSASLRQPASHPPTPMAKLAEADRHLAAIGAEVATLREELARLRADAGERVQLLAERELVIAELSGLLPALEEARVEAIRQAESSSAALTRTETLLSAQASRLAELERRLGAVAATDAAHERVVAELETRIGEEREERDGAERALGEALARTQSAERALAEARARLDDLSGDHERLLAERTEERALAERQAEKASREAERVEALEREQKTLEAALAQRVAGLSELEAELAQARSEHEDMKAVAVDPPYLAAESSRPTHIRFVLRAGGYTVIQCEGEAPQVGQVIELDGERFVVAKTGPSPFPSDRRTCAYLLVEVGPGAPG